MPWCPVCKNEYREGIKLCAECKVELVEQLKDESEESGEPAVQEKIARMQAMLAAQQTEDSADRTEPVHVYQNSAARAQDNRSSAYTLLAVGIVGFVIVLLVFVGVIPVYRSGSIHKYLVCGVMGALFVLFIVFGFVSMRNSKILLIKAKSENSLLSEMTKWCEANLNAEQIDAGLFPEEEKGGIAEEQKYFGRTDKMKAVISDKFMNLDEALLEHFVDEYYQDLFEKR